ncbi:MAG: efflux RND transporter periplasmic adaptor subunit [Flavobacteriales bacterium]|nr:efflux RND transporter periplasmic adaptor subunit [Flavobacteriales bacterium]
MKKIIILLSASISLVACGGNKEKSVEDVIASNSLEEIRAKKEAVSTLQTTYADQLELLNAKIAELDTNKKIALISSFTAQEEIFNHYIELQGNVSTNNLVVISPEYSGILTSVYVKEGQQVSKGQQLAKIDDGGLTPQLAQMKIQANLAKTTFERQERLWKQKIGSEIQYLQAKSNAEAQEKSVKQVEEQIAKTVVTAPFSGTIDEVITEQGNMVSPGISQLFRIVNLNNMHIETDVPERHITSVIKGKSVEVELPVLGEKMQAKITQVGSFINPANRTFKIEIPVTNERKMIKPNLTAKIRINDYTNEKALLIPQSIISENANGQEYLYVITKKINNVGIAQKVIIETGQTEGDFIEVLKGIKNGSEVILEGARSIKDGQEVKVITTQK